MKPNELKLALNFLKMSLWREFKSMLYFKIGTALSLIDVIINLIIYYIISHGVVFRGVDYSRFIIIGVIVNSILSHALTSPYNSVIASYWSGRLELLLSASISPVIIILVMSITRLLRLSLSLTVYVFLGLVFGLTPPVYVKDLLLILYALLTGVLSCTGIGLLGSSMIYHIDARGGEEPITWITMLLSGVVSGAYFPIDMLPSVLQNISWVFPHRYVLDVIREVTLSGSSHIRGLSIELYLLLLSIYALSSLLVGCLAVSSAIKKARKTGALSRWV